MLIQKVKKVVSHLSHSSSIIIIWEIQWAKHINEDVPETVEAHGLWKYWRWGFKEGKAQECHTYATPVKTKQNKQGSRKTLHLLSR